MDRVTVVARWDLFVGIGVSLVVVMLGLARMTQRVLSGTGRRTVEGSEAEVAAGPPSGPQGSAVRPAMGTRTLLANVALSHGLLGTLLLASAWYARIPAVAFGASGSVFDALPAGVVLGAGLYAANEGAAWAAGRSGIQYDERLRELLAPSTLQGWLVLLVVVLPLIAAVEELLFRGTLIGVLATAYGLPAWGLAVVSSVLFGFGHGLQGVAGIMVTTALGFVLAAAFLLTGDLFVVVVAHYLINALEFVVHEGLEIRL